MQSLLDGNEDWRDYRNHILAYRCPCAIGRRKFLGPQCHQQLPQWKPLFMRDNQPITAETISEFLGNLGIRRTVAWLREREKPNTYKPPRGPLFSKPKTPDEIIEEIAENTTSSS